jgi:hypothetical protein
MMTDDKAEELKYIRELLEKEKAALELQLKSVEDLTKKADLIGKINLIRFSQELLRRCFEYNVLPRNIWRKVPMPDHQYSEYRLMQDFETEDRKSWEEVPNFRLHGGEVIIG